ncbi:hypothetical protein F5146DRAFT_1167693 [Armillaria mellea]|nr:hypothetical protein F5146DRAFT_1167693 [Armillaria mellea]
MIPTFLSFFSSDDESFSPSSFTLVMDSNGTWTGRDVHSSNPNTSSSGFDWDITGQLMTTTSYCSCANISTSNESSVPRDLFQEFGSAFNVLSSMPPFCPTEPLQVIESSPVPYWDLVPVPIQIPSLFKKQAPEFVQTSWTELDLNSTDIVNSDPEFASGVGDVQMPDRLSSLSSRDLQCGGTRVLGTQPSSPPVAQTNNFHGREFSPRVNGIHAGNETIFNLNTGASLFLEELYGTEDTHMREDTSQSSASSGAEGPRPDIENQRLFQEQSIERLPSALTSQKTSHTLSDSETNPGDALSWTSSSRSSDDDLASVASSLVSVSSEFSVDVLPCPEGFHRAEFDPRQQEVLAQKLNLPVEKVFYYESLQDETTHKCPLGCGTEFPGYTIREHMRKFHKGMCNGPQVQCDRSLLPEGSNIQCSGEKMSGVTCLGTSNDAALYIPNVLSGGHSLWYADLHTELHLRNVLKCLRAIIDAPMLA